MPFQAHVNLLRLFVTRRAEIVERVQDVLNAQRRPIQHQQDRSLLWRYFEDCFYSDAAVSESQARLRGQLEQSHWASGFKPRDVPELHNDLVHPAEMMRRAFYCWQQTRWPGRNGRVRYAETLFNLYLIRCLELLSMRLWDDGPGSTGERLAEIQDVLDEMWKTSPTDQPVIVKDARWLVPLAQSPTTDDLAGYFAVAKQVAETLAYEDRLEIQKAHVQMIGGHLRSQIRHYCIQDGVSLDEKSVVLRTRTSNALDFALLIQNLVSILGAYEQAGRAGDGRVGLELAGAIFQAISPDPELFLNRIDLLGAYSMIEHLFVATEHEGGAEHTPMGRRHLQLLREYGVLLGRVAKQLHDDCARFSPTAGEYSPFGVFYGTPSNLTEHIAFKTIQRDVVARFGLEDVFMEGDADKLAWVNGWRQLPHIDPEVQKLHEYPHAFAEGIFRRIERALSERITASDPHDDGRGRLWILSEELSEGDSGPSQVQELSAEYVVSSDPDLVEAQKASPYAQSQLLRDRQEGHFAVSYQTAGGWVAIRKDFLTEVLGAGRDVKVVGLPAIAADVLRLMCPGSAMTKA